MSNLFLGSQVAALLCLLLTRSPYRWLLLAFGMGIIQTIQGRWFLPSGDYYGSWRMRDGEALALILMQAACLECIALATGFVKRDFARFQMKVAIIALPVCLVGLGIAHLVPLTGFLVARSWIWVGLSLSLLLTLLLTSLERIGMPWRIRLHLCLLLAVLSAHAGVCWAINVPDATWYTLRSVYRWTVILASAGWAGISIAPHARDEKAENATLTLVTRAIPIRIRRFGGSKYYAGPPKIYRMEKGDAN